MNPIIDSGNDIRRIVDVDYIDGHRVHLSFDDGTEGSVDLADEMQQPPFEALRDVRNFVRFGLERGALVWGDRLDMSAEYLYRRITSVTH